MQRKWSPHTLKVGMKMVQFLWKSLAVFKNINIELPKDREILLRGKQLREMKTYLHTKPYMLVFTATLFMKSQKAE